MIWSSVRALWGGIMGVRKGAAHLSAELSEQIFNPVDGRGVRPALGAAIRTS